MAAIALITGANRGLGLEIARHLGRSGSTVIVAARDVGRGERAAGLLCEEGLAAEPVTLDVTSAASVEAAADEIEARHGRLDILVNNAGILPEAVVEGADPVDTGLFEETFATNVLGVVRVTQAFLPLLQKSAGGRIVNVSSRMGSLADQLDPSSPYFGVVLPAYQSSKVALNGITVALAKRLADTAIKVNSVCPGFVQTDLTPQSRSQAPLTAADAATIVAETALIADDGPSGTFIDRDGAIAW